MRKIETTGDIPNATTYDQQLLAATYVVEDDQTHDILAYFSLLHDKLEREFIFLKKLEFSFPSNHIIFIWP